MFIRSLVILRKFYIPQTRLRGLHRYREKPYDLLVCKFPSQILPIFVILNNFEIMHFLVLIEFQFSRSCVSTNKNIKLLIISEIQQSVPTYFNRTLNDFAIIANNNTKTKNISFM